MQSFSQFRAGLAILVLFVLAFGSVTLQSETSTEQPPEIRVDSRTGTFFVYGDTRFTDPSACELSASMYRRSLIDGMAHAKVKPDFLIITGDVVYKGDSEHDWHVFQEETKTLRDEKIPVFPVLGNHDVHGRLGQTKFMEHFETLKSYSLLKSAGWYLLNYANAEFLMLDSQSSYSERSAQGDWIRKELKAVPEEVSFLFVVLHHPLITHASRMPSVYHCNGRHSRPVMGHDVEDAEKLLKSVLDEFAKTHPGVQVVVLSGHNHNYERYVVNGITYLVTAGGGATPYRINRRPSDVYSEPGPTYHYCKFTMHGNSIIGEMFKLTFEAGGPRWERKDQFELSAPGTKRLAPSTHR